MGDIYLFEMLIPLIETHVFFCNRKIKVLLTLRLTRPESRAPARFSRLLSNRLVGMPF